MANKLKKRALGRGNRGMNRMFNTVSEDKIRNMMKLTFQQRTEAKIKWAVKCYNDWREMRLSTFEYEEEIFNANINDFSSLKKDNLEYALCRFVCEVKKSREEGDNPGHTLYQMVCAIQNHLRKGNIMWKLVHGDDFLRFQRVLDKVM